MTLSKNLIHYKQIRFNLIIFGIKKFRKNKPPKFITKFIFSTHEYKKVKNQPQELTDDYNKTTKQLVSPKVTASTWIQCSGIHWSITMLVTTKFSPCYLLPVPHRTLITHQCNQVTHHIGIQQLIHGWIEQNIRWYFFQLPPSWYSQQPVKCFPVDQWCSTTSWSNFNMV